MSRAALSLLSTLGLLLACAAGCAPRLPPLATSADSQRAHVELAALEEGRTLLLRKCGSCHRAPFPRDYTAGEWPSKLDEMSARASLDFSQRRAIEQYLVVMASAPPAPARR